MIKKYIFRKQLKNRGCYAEILFDVKIVNSSSQIHINYMADPMWEAACKAGLLIFYDYFVRKKEGGLEINIHEIRWLPVDTNNLIIIFAIIQALNESLELHLNGLDLDIKSEKFVFPETRSFLV